MGHKWDFLTVPRVNVTVAVGVLQPGVRVMKNMEGTLKVQVERASAFNFELSKPTAFILAGLKMFAFRSHKANSLAACTVSGAHKQQVVFCAGETQLLNIRFTLWWERFSMAP